MKWGITTLINELIEKRLKNVKIVTDNLTNRKIPNGYKETIIYFNNMLDIFRKDNTITKDEVNSFFDNMEKILLHVFIVRSK